MGVRTVKLPPNLFHRAPSTIVPAKVEDVVQYFDNNTHSNFTPILLAEQVYFRIVTVFVRMSNFAPHFLAPLLPAERQSLKAILQLVVPALV